MKKINIGINGFGRIGRTLFRLLNQYPNLNVVAINDLADAKTLAHLLKYDSVHGIFNENISNTENTIVVNGNTINLTNASTPKDIPWHNSNVDLVIESSGKFKTQKELNYHLKNGANKVILSVPPADNAIKMIVYGINHTDITAEDHIISNASCTTNNAAPMVKVINDLCGIEQAYITTIHSYTTDQSLHDQPHRDLRRARAAGQSIIPTTTGAARALTKIFPELAEVIGGCGIRVPVPNGSLTDITFNVKKETSIQEINNAFKYHADNNLKKILYYTEDPIVSIDVNNSSYSCTFDSQMTSVIGKMVKVIGWYDNESGYSSRIIDLINLLVQKKYI
ncbi:MULTISPECIES: type I glyceraldehyde-3-phosphate dehydrogenase [Cellulophaga]|uniref:Glyceraldehyde-3-phosphate dehydrogenase, type I n=2 Tax=Cellulophaga TaxID=104264 RepID=F0RAN1_CELLC|nr:MULTISPECIES: type I glyceraldehyde-3-phosphate dehydrogenase [Cellulophaga]ADY28424.1 glyceraldehyde-3-phosphate dehydrogenase, type I [Cellulophaga lytica DSM 7489]AIM59484.1 glyceraldehyde-3-phosphate dehydrogenase [Cellulophaga lytica]APU09294.1 type I glyceraldehyde-3-phosphate dehydrogenase [Cellulophaga lytica]EWH12854.1 glyceraldehyde-3-phosphate dehydrogenase, type I [Cellulophaga geojensis KL-A]MDO6854702.1 type I glyceraldehyde-3-phosphate dehydrogenase [Cellulophaga lytica]